MPSEDRRKRDPYDPRTGATGNDEPTESDRDDDEDTEPLGDGEELGG